MLIYSTRNLLVTLSHCFFFQAEDGIRDRNVIGVQTCALPISIGMIEDEHLLQASTEKGEYVRKRMDTWIERFEAVGDVRGKGLSIGIDIVADKDSKTRDAEAALKVCNRCFDNGVVIIAVAGNVLRFQPPLVITYNQLDTALNVLESAIEDLASGKLDNYDIAGQGW